ncbi:hypothetical protein ACIGFK_19855 [Streptomyces sp. NPDC085524]|uniref:hypothetical protein n=1 Tax=unclassified Streptomyces TaxID=2593676 RepID=UPI0036A2910D
MDDQGGAGGVPLHDDGEQARHRKPHADRRDDRRTAAADTDEASRLDRPQQPEKASGKTSDEGTRWVGPKHG